MQQKEKYMRGNRILLGAVSIIPVSYTHLAFTMKKKLTIDEQIEDLKKKGVTFEIMCEEDAKKFLRYNNYYFKDVYKRQE